MTTQSTSIDPSEVRNELLLLGLEDVKIEPSAVTFSPYDYVYVYLTDEGYAGDHIIISDALEYGDEGGYIVGRYADVEESGESFFLETLGGVVGWVRNNCGRDLTGMRPCEGEASEHDLRVIAGEERV